jgi:hypothetical protein
MSERSSNFVLCIQNEGYPAALELRKIYQTLMDSAAAARGFLRVIDESGDDYLYPARFFVPIQVPQEAESVFSAAR